MFFNPVFSSSSVISSRTVQPLFGTCGIISIIEGIIHWCQVTHDDVGSFVGGKDLGESGRGCRYSEKKVLGQIGPSKKGIGHTVF